MKIPNYDTKSPTQGRSLCNFLDEDFRLLISGQSGCGKTNTVMHILRKPLVYYDKIHFFTPNQHQDKIVDLQKVMKPISKKVGYEVLELHSPEEIMDTSEYPSNNRKVVVLMTLLMHLIEFNQKLQTIGQMAGITEFPRFIFRNLITMFRRRSG